MRDMPVRGIPAFTRAGHVYPVYRVCHIRAEVHEQHERRVWDQHDARFDEHDACFNQHDASFHEHDACFD